MRMLLSTLLGPITLYLLLALLLGEEIDCDESVDSLKETDV